MIVKMITESENKMFKRKEDSTIMSIQLNKDIKS